MFLQKKLNTYIVEPPSSRRRRLFPPMPGRTYTVPFAYGFLRVLSTQVPCVRACWPIDWPRLRWLLPHIRLTGWLDATQFNETVRFGRTRFPHSILAERVSAFFSHFNSLAKMQSFWLALDLTSNPPDSISHFHYPFHNIFMLFQFLFHFMHANSKNHN